MGATDLKPEKSTNLSLGLVLRPVDNASLTLDAYAIRIKDRIALSETLSGPQVRSILNAAGYGSYTGVSFFTNALDTKTHGLDLNGNYRFDLPNAATLTFNGGLNWSKTQVTHVKANPAELSGTGVVLINREALSYVESASPESKLVLALDYRQGAWQLETSAIRYGKYDAAQAQTARPTHLQAMERFECWTRGSSGGELAHARWPSPVRWWQAAHGRRRECW